MLVVKGNNTEKTIHGTTVNVYRRKTMNKQKQTTALTVLTTVLATTWATVILFVSPIFLAGLA